MSSKPTLVLLSHEFPFGNSETSFIEPELPFLQKYFDLNKVITLKGSTSQTTVLKDNIDLLEFDEAETSGKWNKKLVFSKRSFWVWLIKDGLNVFIQNGLQKGRTVISQMIKYYHMAYFLNQNLKDEKVEFIYSYWFDHWSVAMAIYKQEYNTSVKLVSRAHRYEIDANTAIFPTFPFLKIQSKNIDLIAFISSNWKNNFVLKFPKINPISAVFRMGAKASQTDISNPETPFKIVSISGIIPVKQMEKQARVLNAIDVPIQWHHFGANKYDPSLEEMITNKHVEYINHGFISYKNLMEWLSTKHVHFLLSTSKVEGVPVSMMESLSFGIPVFALDVGGVSEIVTEKTGVLCDAHLEHQELAKILKGSLLDYKFKGEAREQVREFQKQFFSIEKNYNDFCKAILSL